MRRTKVRVVQQAEEKPVSVNVLAQEIVKISNTMKEISQSRLSRHAIVALIHDRSRITKGTIEIVLNNLEQLEANWLKKVAR